MRRPIRWRTSTTRGAASGPCPRISASFFTPGGVTSRTFRSRASGRVGRARRDGLLLRAHASGDGRVAREVEAFLHGDDRRQRQVEDVAAARHLLLAADAAVGHDDALEPGCDGEPERMRDTNPDLVPARVRRLVPEEDQVELDTSRALRLDRRDDRRGGCLRIPLLVVGHEVDRAVDAERHRVAQLLLGLGRPEREDDRLAAVRLHEPHGFLDPALLVRGDREPEVLGRDRLGVLGQHDLPAGQRHALDADEDVHERMRAFSGSKTGVAPATATETG